MSVNHKGDTGVALVVPMACLLVFAIIVNIAGKQYHRRIEALERIVGTETPASTTWTNGHTYSTIVKHSANCPCVKK